ncbi:MAG TPA: phage tail protein, partial [Paracoccus sp. (in: a-proteobacteria)]|nr:phage tail protein [Paracoccus sp. (in: a-proteobacteria)]
MQISADMTPADVLEEIGRSANMRFAEVGGMLKPIVGLPGAAAFAFTDDSILITEGQSYKPFNGLGETFNALSATYPEPAETWSSKDAPEYVDADAVTADNGRYLPTSISYPAAPYRNQVQRLMRAQMRDYRRMRVHQFYLSPEAIALEPLVDMVSWSSNRNGYDNKLFIVEQVDPTPAMNVMVTLREVDPSDYDWSSDFEMPSVV